MFPKITPSFTPSGEAIMTLTKEHIKSDSQIRDIVKAAFKNNGLPYHKPHTFRHSIARKVRKCGGGLDMALALAENFGQESGMAVLAKTYAMDYLAIQAEKMKNIRLE